MIFFIILTWAMPFVQTVYWILSNAVIWKSSVLLSCPVPHFSDCINGLRNYFNFGSPKIIAFHYNFQFFLLFWSSSDETPKVDLSNRYNTFCEFWGRRRGVLQASWRLPFLWFLIIMFEVQFDVLISCSANLAEPSSDFFHCRDWQTPAGTSLSVTEMKLL